jgi:hypothetical protein
MTHRKISDRQRRRQSHQRANVIFVSFGQNSHGYWWAETDKELNGQIDIGQFRHGGPFRTQQEAEKDSQRVLLGPQCKIEYGGMWDPAWDKVQ